MKLKDFIVPKNVNEACDILKRDDSIFIMAGGTSLKFMDGSDDEKIAMDISKLPLDFINKSDDGYEIGALVTLNKMMKQGHCNECCCDEDWLLDKIACKIATQPIRNISTIGGNISRVFYWSDMPVVLLALDAVIRVINTKSGVEEDIPSTEFFKQNPAILVGDGKYIVKSVKLKMNSKNKIGMSYYKESRVKRTFSVMTLATFVEVDDNSFIKDVKIVLGACVNLPCRLYEIEEKIIGKNVSDLLSAEVLDVNNEVENISNLHPREHFSMDYLKALIKVKIVDNLCDALKKALK